MTGDTSSDAVLMEIRERVVRIETKMEQQERLERRVADLETTINQQKGVRMALSALCGAAGALAGVAASVLTGLIH